MLRQFSRHGSAGTLARVRLMLPRLDGALALCQTAALALVVLARVAARHFPVPCRVMSPGPRPRDRTINHRAEGAGLGGRPFVDVDDEPGEHDQRRDVVDDVARGDRPARDYVVEP